jgi:histone H2A
LTIFHPSIFQLLKHVTIAAGGVLPKIHPELLSRKKGGKFPNLMPAPVPPRPKFTTPPKKAMAKKQITVKGKGKGGGTKGKVSKLKSHKKTASLQSLLVLLLTIPTGVECILHTTPTHG